MSTKEWTDQDDTPLIGAKLRYVAEDVTRRPRINWTVLVLCLLILAYFVVRALAGV